MICGGGFAVRMSLSWTRYTFRDGATLLSAKLNLRAATSCPRDQKQPPKCAAAVMTSPGRLPMTLPWLNVKFGF